MFLCFPPSPWTDAHVLTGLQRYAVISRLVLADSLQLPWSVACQAPLSIRILQARSGLVMPSSRRSFQPRDWTQVSHIAGGFFTSWATRGRAPSAFNLNRYFWWYFWTDDQVPYKGLSFTLFPGKVPGLEYFPRLLKPQRLVFSPHDTP